MATVTLKTEGGRIEVWSRDDEDEFLPEALAQASLDYEQIDRPTSDARGFLITTPDVDASLVRQALNSTGVQLTWNNPASPPTQAAVAAAGSANTAAGRQVGQYRVRFQPIDGDADHFGVDVRDAGGNAVDPRHIVKLTRTATLTDLKNALPPDAAIAGHELPLLRNDLRDMLRNR